MPGRKARTWHLSVAAVLCLAALVVGGAATALASAPAGPSAASAGSGAQPQTLSGACTFSGPITPTPPITVVPKPGSHFSYAGTGSCQGTFDGAALAATPITLTFTNVSTAFDTCEFGPDYNLGGTLAITVGTTTAHFAVTIDLTRLALAGPFTVTTAGGGRGSGTATFTPAGSTATAITQCVGTGIAHATLAGSFTTTAALQGTLIPAPPAAGTKKHKKHTKSKKHRAGRHRRRPAKHEK
jgi:hypothetical protein